MNLKVGDVIRFKDARTMARLQSIDKVMCGWNKNMNYLCGQTRIITQEILDRIEDKKYAYIWQEPNERSVSFNDKVWYISLDMIEPVS